MTIDTWQRSRLIPVSGISGAEEQESRAASALLAVLPAVKEFSRALLSGMGAPAGSVETYIEVPFKLNGRDWRPDGLIKVARGSRSWTCLVEFKTGKNDLQAEQLEAYLDIAREQGFDALLTISNQIPAASGQHPTKVDGRKLRKVTLHHLSWSQILATAVLQKEHRGVSDPEQAWILGELIRYLEHPKSGALEFDDMGADWVTLREQVAAGTLRATDASIPSVAARFDALLGFTAMQLGRRLGADVSFQLSRKEQADPGLRADAVKQALVTEGVMRGAIRIPNTVGDLHIVSDLRASKVTCSVTIDAPRTGRPVTRVNWLLRQMKEADGRIRIEANVMNQRGPGAAELLKDLRERPELLVLDPSKELKSFVIALTVPMGTKRGRAARGGFIDSVLAAVDDFYEGVMQSIKPWAAAPPRLQREVAVEVPDTADELIAEAPNDDAPIEYVPVTGREADSV